MDLPTSLQEKLSQAKQEHLIQFWDELDEAQHQSLASQIEAIDFAEIADNFRADSNAKTDWADLARRAKPPEAIRAGARDNAFSPDAAREAGEAALREGKVGFVLVAGGQGTRLGFPHPKGMFPIGPVSNRTLFEVFTDIIRARSARYGNQIPLFLMTSPATHDATVDFMNQHNRFKLSEDDLQIFCQGTMPAVDAETGKVLLESKSSIARSPDGHGGMLAAMEKSGCLAAIEKRGIEQLCYGQVDNPLLQLCEPLMLGYHLLAKSELTSQVVNKAYPLEKVGNVASIDGRLQVIEYSDLPEEAAHETTDDGSLKLWAGSIAVHVFAVDFLKRMVASPGSLPFHLANKKVPHIDNAGNPIEPELPNAIKFERFIFDLLPNAKNAIVIEGVKSEVFAPVKNAAGSETDTAELAKQAIVDLHRSWLESAGAKVAGGVAVEISPFLALDADELATQIESGLEITEDTYLQKSDS